MTQQEGKLQGEKAEAITLVGKLTGTGIRNAVLYTVQSLTEAQQAQARANIGAGTPYTLPEASPDALGGVKADAAETADTQPVRKGTDGKLYTAPGGSGEAVLYTAQSLTDDQKNQARANIGAGTPYTLPEASPDALGGVKADAAETADTQPVRKGTDGKLYTAPGGSGEAVLYTAQSLTDAQKNQARANIGAGTPYTLPEASSDALGGIKADAAETADTQPVRKGTDGKLYTAPGGGGADISLGISGATAGQVAKVKTVDASGAPTAWEATVFPEGGGGSSEFKLILDITLEEAIFALILKNDSNGNPISCNEIFAALYIPETFTGTEYFIGAFYPDAEAGQIAVKFSSGNRHYTTIYVTPVGGIAAVSKSTNAYSVPVYGVSSFAITPGGNAPNNSSVFEHPEKLTGIRLQGDWREQNSLPIGTKVILYGR